MDAADIEDIYPLSPAQEGMLLHSLRAPSSGTYVEQLVVKFQGPVDEAAMRHAWQETVQHHPVLRTAFVWRLDKPLQVVRRVVDPPFAVVADADADADAIARADRGRGFDLEQAPLMRFTLAQRSDGSHLLVWTYHHLLLDGWSGGLVLNEALVRYRHAVRGETSVFPAAPPYRDYVAWTQRQDAVAMEAYWRAELGGLEAAPKLELDGVSARDADENDPFAEVRASLPADVAASLMGWGRARRLTPNAMVSGAWALLLGMHLDTRDVAFGMVVAVRPPDLPGAEHIVGPLVNTLLVRAPAPDGDLAEWLRALQARQIRAQEFSYTPLSQIPAFSSAPVGQPLFETLLVYENYPAEASLKQAAAEGLAIREVHMIERTHYPLTLIVVPGKSLDLRLIYDRRRFGEADAQTLFDQFLGLLALMPSHSGSADALPFRLAVETPLRAPVLVAPDLVHERLRAQAAAAPEAPAISWRGTQVGYGDLARLADEIATALSTAGVKRGDRVAILAREGIERIASLWATWERGAAFVALDPTYPDSRLQQMLDDAEPAALIVDAETAGRTAAKCFAAAVVALPVAGGARGDTQDASGEDAAYLAYTSGSTGRPKAVVQSHRAFCQYLDWQTRAMSMRPGMRIAQWASISYDAGYAEIFGALVGGATLCLAEAEVRHDPPALVAWLRAQRVTHLWVVPSFLRQLLPYADDLPDLKVLMLSGEALSVDLARAWLERTGGRVELYNLYGPTECVLACSHRVETPAAGQRGIPIGRAFEGREMLVLRDGRLCPTGASGELYIRSRYLSQGYFRRPEETARVFMQNPLRWDAPDPVYRTGDFGRRLPNGDLEFLGRGDFLVKLRGMRIEIEDVESALLRHPEVPECIVAVRRIADSDERLVAWIGSSNPPSVESLRAHLAGLLPHFMIPSRFVFLERLPRTQSGKLQRTQLPEGLIEETADFAPAVGETEARIAGILAELLAAPRLGRHEDFFAAGGHSLLAISAVNRLRDAFAVEVSLREFFARPTVAGLAEWVETARRGDDTAAFAALVDDMEALSEDDVREMLRTERPAP